MSAILDGKISTACEWGNRGRSKLDTFERREASKRKREELKRTAAEGLLNFSSEAGDSRDNADELATPHCDATGNQLNNVERAASLADSMDTAYDKCTGTQTQLTVTDISAMECECQSLRTEHYDLKTQVEAGSV